jgi:hypothetical protein
MRSSAELLNDAEATERLASLVSYRPDKERLLTQAARLRHEADRVDSASVDRSASKNRAAWWN